MRLLIDFSGEPKDERRYNERVKQMKTFTRVNLRMMMTSTAWGMVRAHYGGATRAIIHLAIGELQTHAWHHWIGFAMWVSDRVGWSKVYHFPETKMTIEHYQRHGRKCSGSPNCENLNCIDDSQPKWFRKLMRLDIDDEE